MQSAHTRMRRAVEKENRDIDEEAGRAAGGKQQKRRVRLKKKSRKPINLCLLLIVLSPVLVIGILLYATNQYASLSGLLRKETQVDGSGGKDVSGKSSNEASRSTTRLGNNQAEEQQTDQEANSIEQGDNQEVGQKIVEGIEATKPPEQKQQQNDKITTHDKKFLVLTTTQGNIKITLRPDLSKGSVDYIYKLVESYGGKRCLHCNFYRAEKPGILQGIMENKDVVPINTVRGTCPEGAEGVPNDCPPWDKDCGCHGPIMTRGAVAWAAGDAGGPDFFIDAYKNPADWWGTQHTNFGFIDDEASLDVVDAMFELPIESTPDMDFIKDPIHFDLLLE
ncbi:unnamed protein product [Pseudo-nitzschia multistriata]|uniref:Uncharacterized protein n=1 Tax=Pseudo-nitzschia multistriata TaxID=183589 RepID=A0A448ZJP0_9STRA|nr:unnamed protein product [Pseudo-nitzschia multistriata]